MAPPPQLSTWCAATGTATHYQLEARISGPPHPHMGWWSSRKAAPGARAWESIGVFFLFPGWRARVAEAFRWEATGWEVPGCFLALSFNGLSPATARDKPNYSPSRGPCASLPGYLTYLQLTSPASFASPSWGGRESQACWTIWNYPRQLGKRILRSGRPKY